jgi:hypothetical protein
MRAFLRQIWARLWHKPASGRLLSFEEVRRELAADNRVYLGRKVVEVARIVGSVGRYEEFNRDFMPARASLGMRWKLVDRAFYRFEELPPVSLYKIGEEYFVRDGNHRISVARYQGVELIEAEVTEFRPLLSTGSTTPRIGHNHAHLETSMEKGAKTVDASRIMASYSQQ